MEDASVVGMAVGGVSPSSASSVVSFADCEVRVRLGSEVALCWSSPLPELAMGAGEVVMGAAKETAATRTSAKLHFCTRQQKSAISCSYSWLDG